MKNAFYFMLKAFFVPEVFKYLSWLFGYEGKLLGKKAMVNFKMYGVTYCAANNYNTDIVQYLKKQSGQTIKFSHVIK